MLVNFFLRQQKRAGFLRQQPIRCTISARASRAISPAARAGAVDGYLMASLRMLIRDLSREARRAHIISLRRAQARRYAFTADFFATDRRSADAARPALFIIYCVTSLYYDDFATMRRCYWSAALTPRLSLITFRSRTPISRSAHSRRPCDDSGAIGPKKIPPMPACFAGLATPDFAHAIAMSRSPRAAT